MAELTPDEQKQVDVLTVKVDKARTKWLKKYDAQKKISGTAVSVNDDKQLLASWQELVALRNQRAELINTLGEQ